MAFFLCVSSFSFAGWGDTTRIKQLGDSAWAVKASDINLAKTLSEQELQLALLLGDKRWVAFAYNDRGTIEFLLGNFLESEKLWQAALAIRQKAGDQEGAVATLSKLGSLYTKRGDFKKALEAQLAALKYYEKLQHSKNVALTLSNIATLYCELSNSEKANEYAYAGLAASEKSNDKQALQNAKCVLARSFMMKNKTDSALILYRSALLNGYEINDLYTRGIIYNNLASVWEAQGKQDSALRYFLLALENAVATQNKGGICRNANAVGLKYLERKEPDKAAPYLEQAITIAKAIDQRMVVYGASASLAEYYRQKGDYKRTSEYLEDYIQVKDSIYQDNSAKAIAEMQTRYETEKKQQEIEIKNLQLTRRTILLVVVIALFIISGFIGYLIYHRTKLEQQTVLQAEMLKQQELRAKAVLEAEEQERQRIGKDLHDGVGQLLSALKLNLSNFISQLLPQHGPETNTLKNSIDLADEAVREVRSISHNLMPNALLKSGLVKAVRDFVSKIDSEKLKVTLEITGLTERLDQTVETVVFRCIQELMNNIIKHSEATSITIQLLQFDKELTLLVEDNGKGFDTTLENEGIGLKNLQSRVAFLNGTMHLDSYPERGTTITIEIPL